EKRPGEKFYYWEMLGVPVRVEVGPRDLKERKVTIAERASLKRSVVDFNEAVPAIKEMFKSITESLRKKSSQVLEEMTINAKDLDSLKEAIRNRKIVRACWCENAGCAETIKEVSEGEVRGNRVDIEEKPESPCVVCGKKAERVIYVAKAY
ncbi:hypothetical protein KEJ18_03330, partial [Candidatus Bathyarchaeota archaeon]|nr:hypothetical protein [Candidatus Bathyarchaeota archaeon]